MYLTEKEMEIFNSHFMIVETRASVTVHSELNQSELTSDINEMESLDEVSLDLFYEDSSMTESEYSIQNRRSQQVVRDDFDFDDIDSVKAVIQELVNEVIKNKTILGAVI